LLTPGLFSLSNVTIPSEEAVDDAKEWVEENEK